MLPLKGQSSVLSVTQPAVGRCACSLHEQWKCLTHGNKGTT